jgi:hypothetical protein
MWVVEIRWDQRSSRGFAGCTADMFRYQYCESSECEYFGGICCLYQCYVLER